MLEPYLPKFNLKIRLQKNGQNVILQNSCKLFSIGRKVPIVRFKLISTEKFVLFQASLSSKKT